ncbi:hypothetical protein WKI68_16450 [Streptomyces sp. MS1.HAVA.3]|uniref:Uncharacterized protein n=1 Tax=Streptomyces caledonius TaxID=3134107 RepID=A0ABU8U3W8_9ACTN
MERPAAVVMSVIFVCANPRSRKSARAASLSAASVPAARSLRTPTAIPVSA